SNFSTGVWMKRCPVCSMTYEETFDVCPFDAQTLVLADSADKSVPGNLGQAPRLEDQYIGKLLINKFRIDALIGRGGMGAVYRATDVVLDRSVAVKLLRSDVVGTDK